MPDERGPGHEATGRGVRVAVVDSGVNPANPHVGRIAGGIGISPEGDEHTELADRLGHGTAVAAAILEKAPDVDLFVVKVFDGDLSTRAETLVAAIRWAARHGMRLVNLSLGTPNAEHTAALQEAVTQAHEHGTIVVAAGEQDRVRWLPGSLTGVVGVQLDWDCPRHECRRVSRADGTVVLGASGFPRPIPGVAPERNLKGISFAVANVTGLLARALEARPVASVADLVDLLGDPGRV